MNVEFLWGCHTVQYVATAWTQTAAESLGSGYYNQGTEILIGFPLL